MINFKRLKLITTEELTKFIMYFYSVLFGYLRVNRFTYVLNKNISSVATIMKVFSILTFS